MNLLRYLGGLRANANAVDRLSARNEVRREFRARRVCVLAVPVRPRDLAVAVDRAQDDADRTRWPLKRKEDGPYGKSDGRFKLLFFHLARPASAQTGLVIPAIKRIGAYPAAIVEDLLAIGLAAFIVTR